MKNKNIVNFLSECFDKIRIICRYSSIDVPQSQETHEQINQMLDERNQPEWKFQYYITLLQKLQEKISPILTFEQEYSKLEIQLQKKQTQIRQFIRNEQELRLYIETLNSQYQQLETVLAESQKHYEIEIKGLHEKEKRLQKKIKKIEGLSTYNSYLDHTKEHSQILLPSYSTKKKRGPQSRLKTQPRPHGTLEYAVHSSSRQKPKHKKQMEQPSIYNMKEQINEKLEEKLGSHKKNTMQTLNKKKIEKTQSLAQNEQLYIPSKRIPRKKAMFEESEEKTPLKSTQQVKKQDRQGFSQYMKSYKKAHKSLLSIQEIDFDVKVNNDKVHKQSDLVTKKQVYSFHFKQINTKKE